MITAGRAHPAYLTARFLICITNMARLVFIVVLCDEIGEGPKANFYRPDAMTKNVLSSAFVHTLGSAHTAGTPARLPAVGTLKRYSKALEYEYKVKTVALGTLKRYSILSLALYLE
jgi:hypothetical protein